MRFQFLPASRPALLLCFAAAIAVGSTGCKKGPAGGAPPPPAVTVSHPVLHEVVDYDDYPGRLEAIDNAEVKPRVSGFVEAVNFNDGAIVNKGDLLFTIDSRPFNADYQKALADIEKAEAQKGFAENENKRQINLRASQAGSELEFANSVSNLKAAQAAVDAAKASADAAKLNLDFCKVTAPITGRISRAMITQGNLVTGGTGSSTLMTNITSLDPIYCYIDADERSVLKYQKLSAEKKRVSARDTQIPAFMELGDQSDWPFDGMVDFVDNRLDPNTGTLRARAVFPNPNGRLLPGLYARLRIVGSGKYQALLVPDDVVGVQQDHRFISIVKPDNSVAPVPVTIGGLFGKLRAVTSGLTENDLVITNGYGKAFPGTKVTPDLQPLPQEMIDGIAMKRATTAPTTAPAPTTEPTTQASSTDPYTLELNTKLTTASAREDGR